MESKISTSTSKQFIQNSLQQNIPHRLAASPSLGPRLKSVMAANRRRGGGVGGRRERVVEREGMGERVELEARGSCRRRVDKEREEWKREVEFFCFGFFSLSLLQVSLPRQRQNGRKNKTLPRWSLRNLERLCVQRRKTLKTKKEKREKKALRFYSPSPSPWPPPPPPPWPSLSQTTLALGFFASSLALKAARSVSDFGVQGPLLRSL